MNRRQFLKQSINRTAGTVSGITVAAIAGGEHAIQQAMDSARGQVEAGLNNLEARVDKLEHHHRNLIRVGALGLTVSTGIDLSILL